MKQLKILLYTLISIGCLFSCKYDDEDLWNKISSLEERITSLEGTLSDMNKDISSISTIVNALQNNVTVTNIEQNGDSYTITFSDDKKITITNGKDGENAPIIGIDTFEGSYYWTQTIEGVKTWLTDSKGNKIPVTGEGGTTPRLKVSATGYWMVSYDNGISYTQIVDENGKPVLAIGKDGTDGEDGKDGIDGSDGEDGESFFKDVKIEGDELVLILKDGTVLRLNYQGEKTDSLTKTITIEGSLDIENTEGLSVKTLIDTYNLSENSKAFDVDIIENEDLPQLIYIEDAQEKIIMMMRDFPSNTNNKIDAQSTALALVTSHPVFSPVSNEHFKELKELILSSSQFSNLCEKVEQSITNRDDILATTNTDLIVALNNVLEELCASESNIEEVLRAAVATRAAELNIETYPFHVEPGTNCVKVYNTNLTPPYEYTVRKKDNNDQWTIVCETGVLPSRSSYGFLDLFKTVGEIHLGDPITINFPMDGEYLFFFDRYTEAATREYRSTLLADALSITGVSLSELKEMTEISDLTVKFNSKLTDVTTMDWTDPGDVIKFTYECITEYIDEKWEPNTNTKGKIFLKNAAKILNKYNGLYNMAKGQANLYARILWGLKAESPVEFCVSCFEGEITSCSDAGLRKTAGDNQTGYANQRLLLPLEVFVTHMNFDDPMAGVAPYHRVKFEVITGDGSVSEEIVGTEEGYAQTYWTLGSGNPGEEQKVKAVVLDITTGAEISDPVYFTATLKNEPDITIRLDWAKLSGDTDIDLHVVDPNGEEIYYAHMTSASGGWLDRDDVVGPGPEHIYWENAPAGTYTVKVHYYYSETKAVTSYKVTMNVMGKSQGTYSGSLGDQQEVVVGTFTIPENTTRATIPYFIEKGTIQQNKLYPRKK